MPLLLNESDVARCLTMARLIPLMRETLGRFSRGECVQPVRTSLRIQPAQGFYGVMPAHVPGTGDDPGSFGLKSVCFFPSNEGTALPTHLATVLILDPRTGALEAMMDGRLITEMRTAAVSAVSADLLAAKDPLTLAILGSGVQARSHLEAMKEVRELAHVRVWSRSHEHAIRFVHDMHHKVRCPISAVPTVKDALRGARLVVTATSATQPVVSAEMLEPGMHLAVVGSSNRRARELEGAAVKRCRVWVDSRDAAKVEAGDLLLAINEGAIGEDHVVGELGDVVNGTPGRSSADEITMFKSLGMAVEDVATGHMVVEEARAQGIGRDIDL
ncbi:MAG TPA: ornithine cyclodeaminase family protein [Gemmatimonadales bacterium]|jgi:ornithine cyclodeaminase